MPLDLEPVLDLEPIQDVVKLDLEPIADVGPKLRSGVQLSNPYGPSWQPNMESIKSGFVNATSPDAQTVQDALDVLKNPLPIGLQPGVPSNPPGLTARILSGSLRGVNESTIGTLTDPVALAAMATGLKPVQAVLGPVAPLVNRGITAYFAGQMGKSIPEAGKQLGEVLATGTTEEKAKALTGAGLLAGMTGGVLAHAAKPGLGLDVRQATGKLTPAEVYARMTPEARAVADQAAIDALNPRNAQRESTMPPPQNVLMGDLNRQLVQRPGATVDAIQGQVMADAVQKQAAEAMIQQQAADRMAKQAPVVPAVEAPPLPAPLPVKPVEQPAPVEAKPVEPWYKSEMRRMGLDPNRPLNDIDLGNPSVREAVLNDPTLTDAQKQQILKTGSPKSVAPQPAVAPEPPVGLNVPLEQAKGKLTFLTDQFNNKRTTKSQKVEIIKEAEATRREIFKAGGTSEDIQRATYGQPTVVSPDPTATKLIAKEPWMMSPAEYVKVAGDGSTKIGSESKNFWNDVQARTIELRKKNPSLDYDQTRNTIALEKAAESIGWYKEQQNLKPVGAENAQTAIPTVAEKPIESKPNIGSKVTIQVHNPYGLAPEGEKIQTVTGVHVSIPSFPDGEFVAYGKKGDWRIVEKTTGLGAGKGETKADAIANSTKKVGGVGVEKMRSMIEQADKLNQPPIVEPTAKSVVKESLTAELPAKPAAAQEASAPEIIGMGGAVPSEFKPSGQTQTGIKNAAIDAQRQERGESPMIAPARQSNQSAFDEAMAKIDRDAGWQDRLIEELKQKSRAINPVEAMAMLQRETDLRNEFAKATRDGAQAYDDGRLADVKDAELRTQIFSDKMSELEKAVGTGGAGTEAGRALQIRRRMMNDDFTLANLELQKRKDRGFAPITADERMALQKVAEEHKAVSEKLEKELADSQEQRAIAEAETLVAEARLEAARKQIPKVHPKVLETAERIVTGWEAEAKKASVELREMLSRMSAGVDPTIILKVATIGRAKFGRAAMDLAQWSKAMVDEFGPKLQPFLAEAYTASKKMFEDGLARVPGAVSDHIKRVVKKTADVAEKITAATENIGVRIEKGEQDQIFHPVQTLIRALVEKNPKITRDQLNNEVHSVLKGFIPDITMFDTLEAISGLGRYTIPSKAAIDIKIADYKTQDRFLAQQMLVKTGQPMPRTGFQPRPLSDAARQEHQILSELKKKYGVVVTDATTQLGSNLTARKTWLNHRIADLEKEIATKERLAKAAPRKETDAELESLKVKYEQVKSEHNAIFAYEKSIETRRNSIQKRIADLQEKIAKGDYSKKPKKEQPTSPEILDLLAKKQQIEEQFKHGRELERLANRGKLEKAVDTGKEVANATRNILSSWDVSAVIRQGGFVGAGRPNLAAKSIGPMFRALGSENYARRAEQGIFQRQNFKSGLYKQAELYIAPHDSIALSLQEEMIQNHIGNKIPGVKQSNRAFITYLNQLRVDTFDAIAANVEKGGWLTKGGTLTTAEAKIIANYVNVATGRGNIGNAAGAAQQLANVFFSPRLMASRFQLILGQPLWHKPTQGSFRIRTAIGKEYARSLTGLAAVIAIGAMAGATVETDSKSSDFLKLKFGNSRVDLLGGLIQNTVLMSRLISGQTKSAKGKITDLYGPKAKFAGRTESDVIMQFLRSKLAPVPGGVWTAWTGKNVVGEKMTPGQTALGLVTPLSFNDILTVMKEQGIPTGTALGILSLFGAGLQSYEPKK